MRTPRIYIYCRNEEGNLQEDVIALAEGFRELGVPYHGSCNYWVESPDNQDYLIHHDRDIEPSDCDIVIVSYTWPYWVSMKNFEWNMGGSFELLRQALPENLFKKGRRYATVYMDNHDGHRTVSWEREYRKFDIIFRSKLNRRAWHPDNMRPWALGLTNRVIAATREPLPFAERRNVILSNFGASHPFPHGTRELAQQRFEPEIARFLPLDRTKDDLSIPPTDPYDRLMWRQTGYRFKREYYERLKCSRAVACFCGDLIPSMPFRRPESYLVGGNRAKMRRKFFDILAIFDRRPSRSVQWDSFRFWEALAAGCTAFNIDLDYYGVDLPIMPTNGTHYIGIRLHQVHRSIEKLCDDPGWLHRVADRGFEWATTYYSPTAVALRFLAELGFPQRT